jgi:hypothetical protein
MQTSHPFQSVPATHATPWIKNTAPLAFAAPAHCQSRPRRACIYIARRGHTSRCPRQRARAPSLRPHVQHCRRTAAILRPISLVKMPRMGIKDDVHWSVFFLCMRLCACACACSCACAYGLCVYVSMCACVCACLRARACACDTARARRRSMGPGRTDRHGVGPGRRIPSRPLEVASSKRGTRREPKGHAIAPSRRACAGRGRRSHRRLRGLHDGAIKAWSEPALGDRNAELSSANDDRLRSLRSPIITERSESALGCCRQRAVAPCVGGSRPAGGSDDGATSSVSAYQLSSSE